MKVWLYNFIYVILNNVVNMIPCWFVRKSLYKLFGMSIGSGSRINMHCIVFSPWKITIGKNTMINDYVLLDGRGGLVIGNNTNISMYCIVYTASHKSFTDDFEYYTRKTTIGNCCWLGTRSIIMPNSEVSDLTIIGVQSVFKGKSNVRGIYIGNPAKLKDYRGISKEYSNGLEHKYWFV